MAELVLALFPLLEGVQDCIQEPAAGKLGQLLQKLLLGTLIVGKAATPKCLQNEFCGIILSKFFSGVACTQTLLEGRSFGPTTVSFEETTTYLKT